MSNFNSADIAAFKDVWVFCEQREGKLMPTDFELISKGRDLANELGVDLCGLLLGGEGIESAAKELGGYGADKVIVCESPLLSVYNTDAYAKVICDVIEEMKPEAFLIGATNIGRDLAPRCAARLHTGLCADCTHLDIDVANYIHLWYYQRRHAIEFLLLQELLLSMFLHRYLRTVQTKSLPNLRER